MRPCSFIGIIYIPAEIRSSSTMRFMLLLKAFKWRIYNKLLLIWFWAWSLNNNLWSLKITHSNCFFTAKIRTSKRVHTNSFDGGAGGAGGGSLWILPHSKECICACILLLEKLQLCWSPALYAMTSTRFMECVPAGFSFPLSERGNAITVLMLKSLPNDCSLCVRLLPCCVHSSSTHRILSSGEKLFQSLFEEWLPGQLNQRCSGWSMAELHQDHKYWLLFHVLFVFCRSCLGDVQTASSVLWAFNRRISNGVRVLHVNYSPEKKCLHHVLLFGCGRKLKAATWKQHGLIVRKKKLHTALEMTSEPRKITQKPGKFYTYLSDKQNGVKSNAVSHLLQFLWLSEMFQD